MHTEFDKIHLVWRKGSGGRRVSIGLLERKPDGRHVFKYVDNIKELQKTDGVPLYTEFQVPEIEYNGNVAEVFGTRLTKIDRPDIRSFLDFWEVDEDKASDKFYLLGKTQGLVATDNFEFLAEYKLTLATHFLTDLAGLSQYIHEKGLIANGDILSFKKEPENEKDKYAVRIFKGEQFIGYIKKYHNMIFHAPGAEKLKLTVKAVEQNGVVKRVFVKVCV